MQLFHSASETVLTQIKPGSYPYRQKVVLLIGIMAVLKLFLAFFLELGNDEAYYWLYSQYLEWNYFDHPPMVAIWIRIFTANLALDQFEGFLRLGSVAGGALSTWFLFKAVATVHSQKAGWFAAVLYNISFYSTITAGLYILPDSPQMVFWTLSLWAVALIVKDENSWAKWALFGISAGLCIMSKVHGGFLWIGMGGYVLFHKNTWLKKPQLYVALLLTCVLVTPILIWNLKYDFATFRFHSNRVDVDEFVVKWQYFFKELANQIGFNNPVNFFLVLTGLITWYAKRIRYQPALAIYIFIGLPLPILLLFVSLFRNVTLPHWSGPAYVALMPLAAITLANNTKRLFPNVLRWGLGIFLFVYLGYSAVVNFYPGTYGSQKRDTMGHGDITLDMYGWRQASRQFQEFFKSEVAKNKMPANAALITSKWWGAHVEYYFGHPLHLKMIGLGKTARLNEYLWTNQWRKNEVDLNNAYCIIPSDDRYFAPANFFGQIELATVIEVNRSGKPAHKFFVYRLKDLKKQVPVVK
jgi:4-amino-4-deoxy-L-arabinose transferase-like glycosyltransferase